MAYVEAEAIAAALLATVAGGRVYPVSRPNADLLPAAAFSVVSQVPHGELSETDGPNVWRARVQVDIYAGSYAVLKATVREVREAAHLKRGVYGGGRLISCVCALIGADSIDNSTKTFHQSIDLVLSYYDRI